MNNGSNLQITDYLSILNSVCENEKKLKMVFTATDS